MTQSTCVIAGQAHILARHVNSRTQLSPGWSVMQPGRHGALLISLVECRI